MPQTSGNQRLGSAGEHVQLRQTLRMMLRTAFRVVYVNHRKLFSIGYSIQAAYKKNGIFLLDQIVVHKGLQDYSMLDLKLTSIIYN